MTERLRIVPLRVASASEVRDAVLAASDAVVDPAGTVANWLERHGQLLAGPGPDFWAAALLFDEVGAAGWTGWVPYRECEGAWQSTTYLAPRLRGRGLVPLLRCDQVHRAAGLVRRWGLGDVRFVSSVSVGNERSLAASRRYAEDAGWGNWSRVQESDRKAWVLDWPGVDAPHRCFLPE